MASALAEKGIDFTTHVIGFHVQDDERKQLRCLAENTGGMFLTADNAIELKTVASEPAVTHSVPSLRVTAVLHKGGNLITEGVTYKVFEGHKGSEDDGCLIDSSASAQAFFRLPAGEYRVVAEHKGATAKADVRVTNAEMADFVMVMDAAQSRLRVKALADQGGTPLKDVHFWVYAAQQDLQGTRTQITNGGPGHVFKLSAGNYYVEAKCGNATASTAVRVNAGQSSDITIVMGAGKLRLKAVEKEGDEAQKSVRFWVYKKGGFRTQKRPTGL